MTSEWLERWAFNKMFMYFQIYHGMTVADTGYKLLEEEASLLFVDTKMKLLSTTRSFSSIIEQYEKLQIYICLTSSSLNLPAVHILPKSSPPAAYSITIAKCDGVTRTYKKRSMPCNCECVMVRWVHCIKYIYAKSPNGRVSTAKQE